MPFLASPEAGRRPNGDPPLAPPCDTPGDLPRSDAKNGIAIERAFEFLRGASPPQSRLSRSPSRATTGVDAPSANQCAAPSPATGQSAPPFPGRDDPGPLVEPQVADPARPDPLRARLPRPAPHLVVVGHDRDPGHEPEAAHAAAPASRSTPRAPSPRRSRPRSSRPAATRRASPPGRGRARGSPGSGRGRRPAGGSGRPPRSRPPSSRRPPTGVDDPRHGGGERDPGRAPLAARAPRRRSTPRGRAGPAPPPSARPPREASRSRPRTRPNRAQQRVEERLVAGQVLAAAVEPEAAGHRSALPRRSGHRGHRAMIRAWRQAAVAPTIWLPCRSPSDFVARLGLAGRLDADPAAPRRRAHRLARLRGAAADHAALLHRARRRPRDARHRRRGVAGRPAGRRADLRLGRRPDAAGPADGRRRRRWPASSCSCRSCSSGPAPFIVLRGLAGLATAMYDPAARGYITDATPPDRRGEAFGLYGAAQMGGLLLGPAIGGARRGDLRRGGVHLRVRRDQLVRRRGRDRAPGPRDGRAPARASPPTDRAPADPDRVRRRRRRRAGRRRDGALAGAPSRRRRAS